MPTPPSVRTPVALTEEQKLAVILDATGDLDTAQVLHRNTPRWLLDASAAQVAALGRSADALTLSQLKVEEQMDGLISLKTFCIDELNKALTRRWPVVFDVERDYLELPGAGCGCPPTSNVQTRAPAACSLLEAAMQNFTEDETAADVYPAGSAVRVASAPQGVAGLTPSVFAAFCRELDLGSRYQRHFKQFFGLGGSGGRETVSQAMTRDISRLKAHLLEFDAHLALMKGHITEAGHQMILRLVRADGVVTRQTLQYAGRPLLMQALRLDETCIWGVVVFSARSFEDFPDEWCLVFMPGEPQRPLFEYPNSTAFKQYLTSMLGTPGYRDYFARCLDEDDKADFFRSFASTRQTGSLRALPITQSLFGFLWQSHVGKLQIDARRLAVPTGDVDDEQRQKRWLYYLETGVSIASLAGFFVPVLGQLMLGVAVGQLLGEVFEGIEDWQRGDQREAVGHLLGVVENIALMAVTAGVAKGVGSVVSKTIAGHPEFFEPFAAVLGRGAKARLWRQELQAYEQPVVPRDAPLQEDSVSLSLDAEQAIARIEDKRYAVTLDPATRTWRARHPLRPQAYAPELERHVEGGWRLAGEQLERWRSGAYALKRLNPSLADMDEQQLNLACRLTGTGLDQLLIVADDNTLLPDRLSDTLKRFKLEGKLRTFVVAMKRGDTAGNAEHGGYQLHALPALAGWPTGRYIEVLNEDDAVVSSFPATAASDDTLSVHVRQTQLADGSLLQAIARGLYPRELEALLGTEAIKGEEDVQLAKRLGAEIEANPGTLFERLYQDEAPTLSTDGWRSVHDRFPDLPASTLQRLIRHAPSVERLHLRSTGRITMNLAQTLREANEATRLDRALAGFHLPALANADTQKLAIRLLPRLPGWSGDLRLELRERSLNGPLLEEIGQPSASRENTFSLVKSAGGHEVFDGDRKLIARIPPGPESLYTGILNALPAPQRNAAGFSDAGPTDSARMRIQLLDTALGDRAAANSALLTGKVEPLRVSPSCVQGDSPFFSTKHPRALLRKVRTLYPEMSDTQMDRLIDGLGDDPLARARAVEQRQQMFRRLRTTLNDWAKDRLALTEMEGNLSDAYESRQQVRRLIKRTWQQRMHLPDENGRPVCALQLDGMRVGKLPNLPADITFDHVKQLSLKNMALDNDVAYFLKSFKHLEMLDLDSNRITRLPEVISHMPALRRLSLAGNQLQLTEQTLLKLSRLRSLQVLNLHGNPLGATPDVSQMLDLRYLSVRDTRAAELPRGLSRLPYLDRVDLRDNDILQLPDWLFSAPRRLSETINLRHNPLADPSRKRLLEYRDSVGVGMGYLEDDIARLNEQQAKGLWFTERAGQIHEQRNPVWAAFKDDPQADGLFRLLSELGDTADSEYVRNDMTRRVWRVLQAAEADASLREQILDLAANPINCTDSAALNFSHLEVAVEVHQVVQSHGPSTEASAQPLLALGRRLFRLEQVDKIAQVHIENNPTVDPLEVSLAYRTGLAETLDLPGQPRHMRYAMLSGVKGSDLDAAELAVNNAERSPQLMRFLLKQPFWCEFLKRHHPRQFGTLDDIYPPRLEALFERAETLTTADYLQQVALITSEKETVENALFQRLTDDVIKRVDQGICVAAEF